MRLPLSDNRCPERTSRLLFLLGPLLNITVTGQLSHETSSSLWWRPKQWPTERMPTLMSMAFLESVPVELLSDPIEILAATLGLEHYLWFLATSLPLKPTAFKTFLPVVNLYTQLLPLERACPSPCSRCSSQGGTEQRSGESMTELWELSCIIIFAFSCHSRPNILPKHLPEILIFTSLCWVVC